MNKLLRIVGIIMLFVVLLANRVFFPLSDVCNIIICVIAAILICVGCINKQS